MKYIDNYRLQKDLKAKEKLKNEMEHFKISNVHKFMFKFCKDGEFSLKSYREHISRKLSGENLEREMWWKKSSCEKLVRVGLFVKTSEDTYRVTDRFIAAMNETAISREQKSIDGNKKEIRQFAPGQNHRRILSLAKDDVLEFKDVERHIKSLLVTRQAREMIMKQGMIRNMIDAGYLEVIGRGNTVMNTKSDIFESGIFFLTPKARAFMEDEGSTAKSEERKVLSVDHTKEIMPVPNKEKEIKITRFDIDHIIQAAKDGVLRKEDIEKSPKNGSIEKRIGTLIDAGLLIKKENGIKAVERLADDIIFSPVRKEEKVRKITDLFRKVYKLYIEAAKQ
ncbi:hypothetical protein C4544_03625 [candidate division WS5 bacterium]|uniref:Uncharacterized protein n=1 Tax=candidate division WS5 bacterium TaxID=2093353 RepID=A0A419DDG7_9BACT|nr:MAG: hypothetical protein C4544_03625 [candidate division WS5 bacterium]